MHTPAGIGTFAACHLHGRRRARIVLLIELPDDGERGGWQLNGL
jgi:hypothetical protein